MSGRDIKPRLPRMPGARRPRASLVAAAQSQPEDAAGHATGDADSAPARQDAMDVDPAPQPIQPPQPSQPSAPASVSAGSSRPGSGTVTPSGEASATASGSGPPKMKFRPKMPVRRTATQEDVKPDITPSVRGRPAMRARGRGGARGGRPPAASQNTIAAGPFGGTRAGSSRRVIAPPAPSRYQPDMTSVEVYSDNEDGTRTGVIDMEAVSMLSESAPTSVYRDRDLDGGKAKAKEAEKAKIKEAKKKRQAERRAALTATSEPPALNANVNVKAEPLSPLRAGAILPDPNAGVAPPLTRVGDEMIPGDEQQDRDAAGRRVRATTSGSDTGTPDSEEVNAAHAIDLSESESEDEEEDMDGDFVFVEGNDNPEDKLFTFQFPANMPRFVAPAPPPDADGDTPMDPAAEVKPEVKPSPAQLRRRRQSGAPPPEGRIGTLCVMKSGKVKLVMGEGANAIVMNIKPGVPTTFLEHLVHVDAKTKSTTVLGEVHKQYTATPDIERLLEDLFLNGGETPGDRERRAAEIERRNRIERGLVKMEMSSP